MLDDVTFSEQESNHRSCKEMVEAPVGLQNEADESLVRLVTDVLLQATTLFGAYF